MPLIDTHFHLDLYPDHQDILEEIKNEGIYTIAVTNTPSVFLRSSGLAKNCPFVRTALGLHPELAASRKSELALFDQLLPLTRYVGEVGLDYASQDGDEQAAQRHVFEEILERCSDFGDKVLSVHSRRAESDVVSLIGAGFSGTVILHWFSGPRKVLLEAVAAGCYFSVNPAMIKSKSGQRAVNEIPSERILTETDGPFVKVGHRSARPWDVKVVISELANQWNLEADATMDLVRKNFKRALTESQSCDRGHAV